MMNLKTIDHVTLYVPSVDLVRDYYTDVFGFSVTDLPSSGANTLLVERGAVHFFIVEERSAPLDFIRRQHISFEVDSLRPVTTLLDDNNIPYNTGIYEGLAAFNYRWCGWRDPEGIRVECIERV